MSSALPFTIPMLLACVLCAFSVGVAGGAQQPAAAHAAVASLQGCQPYAETGGRQGSSHNAATTSFKLRWFLLSCFVLSERDVCNKNAFQSDNMCV